MEVSIDAVRLNFQSKTDAELLQVAAQDKELTSEARLLLVQELQNRLSMSREISEQCDWFMVGIPW